ncbi:MAG: thiamine pyrophosphate-binding protein [Deltaproteobacteria bacterium]|nr:MAG: thiamine pyrophosphate-binding protein [Deltaproteobacteria bacterium]
MKMTGREALMELFLNEGVQYIFGIPGATEVLFMDVLEDHPEINYILGLHEVVALGMAEGYARASGQVAVVNLHTGAGVAAAMPMLFNARLNRAPLLVTAGQQDTRLLMQEPALAADLVGMARPLTKWSTEVLYAADIPLAIQRAFKVAAHPPAGPVFVSLPQDVLDQNIDFEYIPRGPSLTRLRPDREAISRAVELLLTAQTPAIIVESGIAKSGALAEAVELAELIGAPVYDPWMADVNFPGSHPQYLGDLDLARPQTREMLQTADVLIAIGVPLFRQPLYFSKPLLTSKTKVIQIHDDPWEIGKNFPVAAGVEGDIKISLADLNEALRKSMPARPRKAAESRAQRIAKEKQKITEAFVEKARQERDHVPIAPSRLMQELRDSLKPGTVIVDDCWSCSPILRRTIDFREPQSFQRTRGGSIGWGMPGSLGVKLACPARPVVGVIGDGSSMWSIQSLWTAAHYDIPVTYLICANASYCQVKLMKTLLMGEKAKGRYLGMDLDEPRIDFCQLAQAMGVHGQKVERPEQLREVLDSVLGLGKPAMVEVLIESTL